MKQGKKLAERLEKFCAGRGFALLTTLCVAVIASTALWTRQPERDSASQATPPSMPDHAAAALMQQTLAPPTPTPLPSPQPVLWQAPLPEIVLLRGFSGRQMLRSGVTGVWSVHHAADLAAAQGTPVRAMASGRVSGQNADSAGGAWISLQHDGGYVSRYAALSLLGSFREGDPVSAGQIIGFVGNSAVDEFDLGPHLHLQVFLDGEAVDPLPLFQ